MSSLTAAVYDVLHLRTPRTSARKAVMTYAELIAEVSRYDGVPRDLSLSDWRVTSALLELTHACRSSHLPAISSLVVCAGTREPSEAWYADAFPHVFDAECRRTQWQKEADEACLTLYPKRLMELAAV